MRTRLKKAHTFVLLMTVPNLDFLYLSIIYHIKHSRIYRVTCQAQEQRVIQGKTKQKTYLILQFYSSNIPLIFRMPLILRAIQITDTDLIIRVYEDHSTLAPLLNKIM